MKRGGRRNVERGGDFTERLVRQYGSGQTERWGGAEWMRMLTHFRKNGTLEEAETCFRRIPERLKNVLHYTAMMKIYVRWKRAREVEAYFEQIVGMTSNSKTLNYAYSTILNFYAKRSDVARAEKIREGMEARPGFLPNTHACNALMDVYVNAKDLKRAKRLYAWMETKKIRANEITLNTLLRAYARAGDAEGAETVLRRVEALDVDALQLNYAYSTILNLYAKKGDVAGAREVQKRMEAREGFRPDTETWNALMSVYAYAGDVDGSEKVLERMMDAKGIKVDAITYNTLMQAYASQGDVRGAEKVIERMMDAKGIEVDAITYNTLMQAYASQGDVRGAEKVLERMMDAKGIEVDAITYNTLMQAYASQGDVRGAEKVLERMMDAKGIEVDAITYSTLMQAYASQGDVRGAEKVLKEMKAKGIEANDTTYNTLMQAYASQGDVRGAEKVLERMMDAKGIEVDAITYSTLMQAYASQGDVRGAEKVLERMMDAKGIEANAITYNTLMQAYASQGDVRGAEKVLKEMKDKGIEANAITYSTMMQAYARRGDVGGAEKILTQMKAQGVQANAITYNTMIQTHCRRRDHAAAVRTLEKMLDLHLKPNERSFSLCAHSFFNPKDDDAFWAGLRKLSMHPHALKMDNDFQASSFIFHPWIGAIARDAQRNGSKSIHPLSVVYLLDQIRRLPVLRGAGIRRETRIVALDKLHDILRAAPSTKTIDPCIECIRSELESFACSSQSPPSISERKPWIGCVRGVIRHIGESHEGLSTLLTDLRSIHDKTSARRRAHPLAQLNLAPNPTEWKSIDDTLRRSKVRVIPTSEISFDRLWFQGTSNTLGEGGLKRVVSAVVNGKPYAVVTSKDAYDSDRNDDADADVSKEDTSASKPPSNSTSTPSSSFSTTTNRTEPTRRYTAASKSFTPEAVGVTSSSAQNDRVIISEITHTLALHDAPAALTIAFKVEGCPVYGLPLCALRSLNTLVRTRYGVRTDWITPNLEYAVDLWLRAMRAIHDVHRTGHVHLDIKSDNFLVDFTADDGLRLFIGDFGSVRKVDPDRHCVTKKLGGYTDPWGSPEVVLGSGRVGFAADIWSMACVGIEIFRGCRPWERSTLMKFQDGRGAEIEDLLASALRNMTTPLSHGSLHDAASFFERFDGFVGNGSSDVKVYRDVCVDLYALLTAMFDYDPSKRPSAEKAVGRLENAKQRLAGVHADDPFWHVRTKIQFRPSKDDIDAFAQRMGMDTTKQALSKEQHLSQRREAVSRMMMREQREVPERGGGCRRGRRDGGLYREVRLRRWSHGVVKNYDASRRSGYILPMDGEKDVGFYADRVENSVPVKIGNRVVFQDFVSGDRRKARVVRVVPGTTAGEGIVEFFNQEKGFGRLLPLDGSGVAVYFDEHIVDASQGGVSALRRGTVVHFEESDRRGVGKRHASRVRVKPSSVSESNEVMSNHSSSKSSGTALQCHAPNGLSYSRPSTASNGHHGLRASAPSWTPGCYTRGTLRRSE